MLLKLYTSFTKRVTRKSQCRISFREFAVGKYVFCKIIVNCLLASNKEVFIIAIWIAKRTEQTWGDRQPFIGSVFTLKIRTITELF